MRKSLLLLTVLLSVCSLHAERIDTHMARTVAGNVASRLQSGSSALKSASPELILEYAAPAKERTGQSLRSDPAEIADYYVFNLSGNRGFVIVSGEDRVNPVIAYSTEGRFEVKQMPSHVRSWMEHYQDEITYAVTHELQASPKVREAWQSYVSGSSDRALTSEVLLPTANWNQYAPYNNWCPLIAGMRTLTGCTATAMAIIAKYHEYPVRASGGVPSCSGIPITYDAYDWDHMLLSYSEGGYTKVEADAVAKLMFHCGANIDTDYGLDVSGGYTLKVVEFLRDSMGYDKQARFAEQKNYTWKEWKALLNSELKAGRPVLYRGESQEQGGHAFVCDGYTPEGAYHFNWGWGGYNNGYFLLSTLDGNYDGNGFCSEQAMGIGLQPAVGNEYATSLRLKKSLTCSATPVVPDALFTVKGFVMNDGSSLFKGCLNMAVIDENERIKERVSTDHYPVDLGVWYYDEYQFSCKITQPMRDTDRLVIVYSENGSDWSIIRGGEGMASAIGVNGPISPEVNDPADPEMPLNVGFFWSDFEYSYIPTGEEGTEAAVCFNTNRPDQPICFRYKLKDISWASSIRLSCANSLDNLTQQPTTLTFDANGEFWLTPENYEWSDGLIYHYFKLASSVTGRLAFEVDAFDATRTIKYASMEVAAQIIEPVNIQVSDVSGRKGEDIPISFTITHTGDFAGKDVTMRLASIDFMPEDITLLYLDKGVPRNLPLIKEDYVYAQHPAVVSEGMTFQYIIRFNRELPPVSIKLNLFDWAGDKFIPGVGGRVKINVTSSPVANAEIESPENYVRPVRGGVFLYTRQKEEVRIYTYGGLLCKRFTTTGGEQRIDLAKGLYILCIGDTSYKIKVSDSGNE